MKKRTSTNVTMETANTLAYTSHRNRFEGIETDYVWERKQCVHNGLIVRKQRRHAGKGTPIIQTRCSVLTQQILKFAYVLVTERDDKRQNVLLAQGPLEGMTGRERLEDIERSVVHPKGHHRKGRFCFVSFCYPFVCAFYFHHGGFVCDMLPTDYANNRASSSSFLLLRNRSSSLAFTAFATTASFTG